MSFSSFIASLGCPLKNTRWSWCALSPDGRRAVFTLWEDCFERGPNGRRYPVLYHEERTELAGRPGYTELLEVVEHCLRNPETQLIGVLQKAKDPDAEPRVRESWQDDRVFLLTFERDAVGELWVRLAGTHDLRNGPLPQVPFTSAAAE